MRTTERFTDPISAVEIDQNRWNAKIRIIAPDGSVLVRVISIEPGDGLNYWDSVEEYEEYDY
jgi:hypothetical protein